MAGVPKLLVLARIVAAIPFFTTCVLKASPDIVGKTSAEMRRWVLSYCSMHTSVGITHISLYARITHNSISISIRVHNIPGII